MQDTSEESVNESTSTFCVSLEFFNGPLDLLLHLVRQREVSVEEVEMQDVARQYLELIEGARVLDLELASEYLVVAATLLMIKSQTMLPDEKSGEDEGVLEDSEEFYEELRERLKRYELVKKQASRLVDMPQLGVDVFNRNEQRLLRELKEGDLADNQDPMDLAQRFYKLMKRIGAGSPMFRISLEPISIVSCMMRTLDYLKSFSTNREPKGFLQIVAQSLGISSRATDQGGQETKAKLREQVIGTFIAILELTRRGMVDITKNYLDGDFSASLRISENVDASSDSERSFSEVEGDLAQQIEADWGAEVSRHTGDGQEVFSKVVSLEDYRQKNSGDKPEQQRAQVNKLL